MSKRFGKRRAPDCTCEYNFTCRACLDLGVLIEPAVHAEPHLVGPRLAGTETRFCFNHAHGTPCPLPCKQCVRECPREAWEDSAVNRQRTLEWEARRPK